MAAVPITAAVGLLGSLAGGFLGGSAASKRKRSMFNIANIPGVNIGGIYGEALGAQQGALPTAMELARSQNTFNAGELDRLLESSVPGFRGLQAQRASNIGSFLGGEIPLDVQNQIYRSGAARALTGGYGPSSPAGRNLVARDLGRTSLDLMGLGSRDLDAAIRGAPMPELVSPGSMLDIGAQDVLGTRSDERSERIRNLFKAVGAPSSTDVWAKVLQDMGGQMMGAGGGFGAFSKWMSGGK